MIKRMLPFLMLMAASTAALAQAYPTPNQGSPSGTAAGIPAMGAAGSTTQTCLPGTMCMETLLPLVNGSELQIAQHPTGFFVDDFACIGVPGCTSGTLDVTNKWTAPTTGGGGNATAATNALGLTLLGSGNAASGFSVLKSQAAFQPQNPGYLFSQMQVKVEATAAGLFKTNAFRAFGFYNQPTTPTSVAPLTDAAAFVIDVDGKLKAETWASGGVNFALDLSVFDSFCNCTPQTIVGDGVTHRFVIIFRGDNILWKIDDRYVAQVTTGAQGPDVNTLSIGAMAVAGATPPATSATVEFDQVTVGAIAQNQNRNCDAFFGWRCMVIGSTGSMLPALPQTPIGGNATGSTGAVVGTLAAAAAKFTYLCDFSISALGTANTVGPIVIAGLAGGSRTYQASTLATGVEYYKSEKFNPCLASSAVNTAITITTTAAAGGTAVDVNSSGYQQ